MPPTDAEWKARFEAERRARKEAAAAALQLQRAERTRVRQARWLLAKRRRAQLAASRRFSARKNREDAVFLEHVRRREARNELAHVDRAINEAGEDAVEVLVEDDLVAVSASANGRNRSHHRKRPEPSEGKTLYWQGEGTE
jgi:hypothetical protein